MYGSFDDVNREYIITTPKTPAAWINYLGTLAFGGFVDQTGGVQLCKGDPALNRITKYIPQLPASAMKGTTVYLRERLPEGFSLLSPCYVPALTLPDEFSCHVGLGYTRFVSNLEGIHYEALLFVPLDAPVLLWQIKVTNQRNSPLQLDVIPVVEYSHPAALKQLTNADWVPQTMQSRAQVEPGGLVTLVQYPFMHRDRQINYLTSDRPVSSYDTDRKRFLGDDGYGTWAAPVSLQEDELSNSEAERGDNIGALIHPLGWLVPGETNMVILQLGQAEDEIERTASIERFRQEEAVNDAFQELSHFWNDMLDRFQITTPDKALDRMANVNNPHQCLITMNWSRYLSLYQLGYGDRGMGFRDTCQDLLGMFLFQPEQARSILCDLLSVQKNNGSAMHQYFPSTMEATTGEAGQDEERPNFYSDDHLWAILAVTAYLKETGDIAFLDERFPYYEKDKSGRPVESGTALDHLLRALNFTRTHTGAHGLPLLGFADWNDTVNLPTGAESIFTAELYGAALRSMIDLFVFLDRDEDAQRLQGDHAAMKMLLNDIAWDGDWYLRYFDHLGSPLGSAGNDEGQIFTNAQSWAVISGLADESRGRIALDSVHRKLNTRFGIKLSAPGYDGFDPVKGGVTTYPPGAKENGGIFLHANPWVILAETRLGNGDRAYEYYRQINPAAQEDRLDEYECEPYVYPQNVLGDEHPRFGLARNSWLTGTASWMMHVLHEAIFGICPSYNGLRIDPCIPTTWDEVNVRRHFRGAWYKINIQNPEGVSSGVKAIWFEEQLLEENHLPQKKDGGEYDVRVLLGKTA